MCMGYKYEIRDFRVAADAAYVLIANIGVAPIYRDAYVAVDGVFQGRIPPREYDERLFYGQTVTARVSNVLKDGKLDLSIRKKAYKQMDDDAAAVLNLLKGRGGFLPLNDKSSPEDIKNTTHLSKNAFKRAVGRLLKEDILLIEETGIRLKEGDR